MLYFYHGKIQIQRTHLRNHKLCELVKVYILIDRRFSQYGPEQTWSIRDLLYDCVYGILVDR